MNVELRDVHIGQKLLERVDQLKMSKSEFARLIGVRQQHINRVFESPTIDTGKLKLASVALDFNFFTYYVELNKSIIAEESAIAWGDGSATVMIGDAALSAKIKELQAKLKIAQEAKESIDDALREKKEEYETLKNSIDDQIADKRRIIEFQDEKIKQLEKELKELREKCKK